MKLVHQRLFDRAAFGHVGADVAGACDEPLGDTA